MKKQTVILSVIMIVSLIAGTVLAGILNTRRSELIPEQVAMQSMPIGGLHKFAGDVEWMLFVNYMGGIGDVNEKNADEVSRRLEKLIRLDPNLEQLYRDGVGFLSYADPEKSFEMLKKACENKNLAKSAEIPFYTGLVLVRNFKTPNYQAAAEYFQTAMNRPSENVSLAGAAKRQYYICKAKLLAAEEKIDERLAMLEVLFKDFSERNREVGGEVDSKLREYLLQALQNVKAADEDYTPTKKAIERANEISAKAFASHHLCENCITFYGAGQKFCSNCGSGVKVWGVCSSCGVVQEGQYCGQCGTVAKAAAGKK